MKQLWRFKSNFLLPILVSGFYLLNLSFCCSLNPEGVALLRFKDEIVSDPYGALSNWVEEVGVETPCSWSGVACSHGYVVVLNLKDLCLKGTLAPHIGNLIHLKSFILRNNSFCGVIPEDITKLNELEVLDLGYNNFSGQLPCNLGNNFSLSILLLDNNELLVESARHEIYLLQTLSEAQVEEEALSGANRASSCNSLLISRNSVQTTNVAGRTLLQRHLTRGRRSPRPPSFISSPSPSPSPSTSPSPTQSPPSTNTFNVYRTFPTAPPEESPRVQISSSRNNLEFILLGAIGGPVFLLLLVAGFYFYRSGKVVSVRPWATGLSGQLQRAFVTGVPKLKRSELEAACEDFSNVIGSSSACTFYKGTLSNGVEIAVVSVAVTSKKDWSGYLESQFRKKIDTLSKVSHKNFSSLLGFCEEDEPFTRMLVFEYAPNGTLFEHIHIREAEHLDWQMRMRIAMGIAYCLDHMHQLSPPLAHRNLTSSTIYLTEDYAAKVSDFFFGDEAEKQSDPESNVYGFGVILFEMVTGRLPYSAGSDPLDDWASDYLSWGQSLEEMVDPTLRTYKEDQLRRIGDVIRACVEPNRISMREVCGMMREITGIEPEGAIPKLSPLWWAEIEIMSNDVS